MNMPRQSIICKSIPGRSSQVKPSCTTTSTPIQYLNYNKVPPPRQVKPSCATTSTPIQYITYNMVHPRQVKPSCTTTSTPIQYIKYNTITPQQVKPSCATTPTPPVHKVQHNCSSTTDPYNQKLC